MNKKPIIIAVDDPTKPPLAFCPCVLHVYTIRALGRVFVVSKAFNISKQRTAWFVPKNDTFAKKTAFQMAVSERAF